MPDADVRLLLDNGPHESPDDVPVLVILDPPGVGPHFIGKAQLLGQDVYQVWVNAPDTCIVDQSTQDLSKLLRSIY